MRSISLLLLVIVFIQLPLGLYSQSIDKKLSIGDKIPDIVLENIVNFKTAKAKISDFKGKVLIFDFWGTWCGTCIAAFPKVDSLQKRFDSKLQILPVTTGGEELSKHLLTNITKIRGLKIPSVVEDTSLSKLFEYQVVPHYVWIDTNRIVRAFTGSESLTASHIQSLIDNDNFSLPEKVDQPISLNLHKPFYFDNQLDYGKYKDLFLYSSILTKYNQDAGTGSSRGGNFINCPNHPIKLLYQLAFGEFHLDFITDNRIILEGFNNSLDSMEVGIYRPGIHGNASEWYNKYEKQFSYCYELAFSDSVVNTAYMFGIMRDELNKYFSSKGIHSRMEKRKVQYYALIRTSNEDKIATKGGASKNSYTDYFLDLRNVPVFILSQKFQSFFPNKENLLVQDETNYNGNIDIKIDADLFDIPSVNKELKKYDLKFEKKEMEINMVIISKKSL